MANLRSTHVAGDLSVSGNLKANLSIKIAGVTKTLDGSRVLEWTVEDLALRSATDTEAGIVKLGSAAVQNVAANSVGATAGRTYAIQNDSNGRLVVNVPWVDTNTVYTHPGTDGNKHVPATGTTNNGKFLMAGATAGSFSWADIPTPTSVKNGVYTVGDQTIDGAKTFSSDITVADMTIGRGKGSLSTNTVIGSLSLSANTTGYSNVAIGGFSLEANTTGYSNVAVGTNSLLANTTGSENTAIGTDSLKANTTGSGNVGMGTNSLGANTTGYSNTAVGDRCLADNTTGSGNVGMGTNSLLANTTGYSNTAVGNSTLMNNTTGTYNVAVGKGALEANTTGFSNTAIGADSLKVNTTGRGNIAVGNSALMNSATGNYNTAIGTDSLKANTTGSSNTSVGAGALYYNATGEWNVAVGHAALMNNATGNYNTAVGKDSLKFGTAYDKCTALGYDAQVTGSNQIQLGSGTTTAYTSGGTLQNRSDRRDKADIRDTILGLEFIKKIRPVDYKWDMREDYRPEMPKKGEDESDETFNSRMDEWLEAAKLGNIEHDGSKKRSRYHHGVIAQEVKQTIETLGIDFGGFQDHSVAGGEDVMSIGYDEFIAPLIRAVQELSEEVERLKAQNT